MDDQPSPRPLTRTILLSWKSAVRATGAVGILAVVTIILLTLADWWSGNFLSSNAGRPQPDGAWHGARLIASVALPPLLQAPLLVAFYRHMLLEHPSPVVGDARTTLIFAAWSAILSLVLVGFGIPILLRIQALAILTSVVGLFVQTRLILLLPAIVVGRTRGAPFLSWQATRGRFWWLLAGSLGASSPAWLPAMLIALLQITRYGHPVDRLILDLPLRLLGVAGLLLGAAFAAQVYVDRIGPLNRSPTAP